MTIVEIETEFHIHNRFGFFTLIDMLVYKIAYLVIKAFFRRTSTFSRDESIDINYYEQFVNVLGHYNELFLQRTIFFHWTLVLHGVSNNSNEHVKFKELFSDVFRIISTFHVQYSS